MGSYVVLKTHRVMPWKFEFITEVYNLMALAFSDKYLNSEKATIDGLLHLPRDKNKDRAFNFVFGDKSTYQEADAPDYSLIAYKYVGQ